MLYILFLLLLWVAVPQLPIIVNLCSVAEVVYKHDQDCSRLMPPREVGSM